MKLQDLRRILETEKELTKSEIKKLRERLLSLPDTENTRYSNHLADMAILDQERNNIVSLINKAVEKLAQVEDALKSIDNGTYGICVLCGNEISNERLEVIPYTRICSYCAKNIS